MSEIRTQALGYLRGGRVVVYYANSNDQRRRPTSVRATVYGQRLYTVGYEPGRDWGCTCTRTKPCRHIAAVQLVTGWEGPAWPHLALAKPVGKAAE